MGGLDEGWAAVRAGLALARTAWRRAWAPLGVCAAGWTAIFTACLADLPPDAATPLTWTGLGLVALMTPPKLGALHRLAAGADAADPPGPAGLQWTGVETRLTATLTAASGLLLLTLGAGAVGAAAALNLLRPPESPGVSLLLLPAAAAAALWLWAAGRLLATLPADAAEPAPRFARGWMLTRGAGAAPALVVLLTTVVPTAVVLAGPAMLGRVVGDAAGRWPTGTAVVVGAVLAGLTQGLAAPAHAGALALLHRRGLGREQATVDTSGPLGDKAASPAAKPELQPA